MDLRVLLRCLLRNAARVPEWPYRHAGPNPRRPERLRLEAQKEGLPMKSNSNRSKVVSASKKRRVSQKTLEKAYRNVFVVPSPGITPTRERLSMYKSVPSVTTYGLCERPA